MERNRYSSIVFQFFRRNIAIVSARLNTSQKYDSVIITKFISDYKLGERSRGSYIFPLYDYTEIKSNIDKNILVNNIKPKFNFNQDFIISIKQKYPNKNITAPSIFDYIYAILSSPTYREKFLSELKIDFPRIPFPDKFDTLKSISTLGRELRNLHLMETKLKSNATFNITGTNYIESINYKDNKIFINKEQYFDKCF